MNHKMSGAIAIGVFGFIFFALSTGNIAAEMAMQGWEKQEDRLVLYDLDGRIIKEFKLEKKEEVLASHPDVKFTEKMLLSVTGGASKNGKYGWVDRKESKWLLGGSWANYTFQYFGETGQLLVEKKNSVIGATVSHDGKIIFLVEADPKWVSKMEHGNSYYYPTIYNSDGEVIEKIADCGTYQDRWSLSKNGKYASVGCVNTKNSQENFQLIFDIKKKKPHVQKPGGIDINSIQEDGSFKIIENKQEKNPTTGKYEFKTTVLKEGKFE